MYEIWHEGYAGSKRIRLGEALLLTCVCCHGNDVAHSLDVSNYLPLFPRYYAEAFKELCNSGINGTEQVGDARSNKDRYDVQQVKEYMYSQCHDMFDLSIVRII